jgi:hypothetical protein
VRRRHGKSERNGEQGLVIILVAVVLLFVVGAMAVLAIDVVSFYTARREAQQAADAAALAGARVLANSGMTSNPSATFVAYAESLASGVAIQVATQNKVGGRQLTAAEVNPPTFQVSVLSGSDPRITVQIPRIDLPTFFARIWGSTTVSIGASATAEAYNPSGLATVSSAGSPVAPSCVKPWLMPNLDSTSAPIFNTATGAITTLTPVGTTITFQPRCSDCGPPLLPASPWQYYPGAQTSFPAPTQSLPTCSVTGGFNPHQLSIAGCVQTPIACGDGSVVSSTVDIDRLPYGPTRTADTAAAVNCLSHSLTNNGDRVDTTAVPFPPLQFVAGSDNPVTGAIGKTVLVSDSLVTVPVFDSDTLASGSANVQVIGFVQLFLNPLGQAAPSGGPISATIVNFSGCGTSGSGQPIVGTGASPVPVRLVSP